MGDNNDGSSIAAQSAQDTVTAPSNRGFMGRIFDAFSPKETAISPADLPDPMLPAAPMPGMLNLRRMRVDDVANPKTDIVAVPVTATKDELVTVFRSSGLTRLPVFEGTLDTPIGIANLKDFALKFGFQGDDDAFDEAGSNLTEHDDIDEEDVDTLGGLVFMLSGSVPTRGEIIVHPDGTEFEVLDADPRRIKRLRVRLPNAATD